MSNLGLQKAKEAKNNEFYTLLHSIEKELKHYKHHFKDKVVFCNCDDPFESNFFKYFAINFNHLGLKKLITTGFVGSPIAGTNLFLEDIRSIPLGADIKKCTYKVEITEVKDFNNDGAVDLSDVEYLLKNDKNSLTIMNGNGDFRSAESLALLAESQICVTNPPFSHFREFLSVLFEYDKKFLIIGNQNAITYKDVFSYLKNNEMWLGYNNGPQEFIISNDAPIKSGQRVDDVGVRYQKLGNIAWFTNLDISKRHEMIILYKSYYDNKPFYKHYFNFDAINVDKVADIPIDYEGAMGVPITFLDKYNPEQFDILGLGISNSGLEIGIAGYTAEHRTYRKTIQKRGAVDGDLYMIDELGNPVVPYARILIKRKGIV